MEYIIPALARTYYYKDRSSSICIKPMLPLVGIVLIYSLTHLAILRSPNICCTLCGGFQTKRDTYTRFQRDLTFLQVKKKCIVSSSIQFLFCKIIFSKNHPLWLISWPTLSKQIQRMHCQIQRPAARQQHQVHLANKLFNNYTTYSWQKA
jgi:hypothetical protein